MNAAVICALSLVIFALGYKFYSAFLSQRLFELRAEEPVPARELEDGVDYVPTPRAVLYGHHYASIAGAAPIIGPAIAVIWGWAPALVWIVLGTVFMGAVHDFATLVLSIRHGGKSVGQISAAILGPRTRPLFLLVIFFLILMVIAVFAKAIASLFVAQPGTVLPINLQIVVALTIGWLCHKKRVGLLWPSIMALLLLYAAAFVGVSMPISLAPLVGQEAQQMTWVVLLLVYSFIASVLPVWTLLQPRDYINSHQLVVGLVALIAGIFIANPPMVAPAFSTAPADAPNIVPFLFVTIACGAISGFHGLVSSGTTSKQVSCATDARMIGYGGMLGEGVLAVISTLAVSAGLADWAGHYHSFSAAAKGGVAAFVEGAATFVMAMGIAREPAQVLIAVMVISFAATSLDTAARVQRYILAELGEVWGIKALRNRFVSAAISVGLPLLLCLSGKERSLWPLFGASNQLLAGLSLVVVTVWLYRQGKSWLLTGIPMAIVLSVAAASLLGNLGQYWQAGAYHLLLVAVVVLALELWVVAEGWRAVLRHRKEGAGAIS